MTIKCIKVVAGEKAVIEERENSLKDWQSEVGGLIEVAYHSDSDGVGENVLIICNEEGKLLQLPPNRFFGRDILCGTFFLVGEGGDDFRSLTENEIAWCMNEYGEPYVFMNPVQFEEYLNIKFY